MIATSSQELGDKPSWRVLSDHGPTYLAEMDCVTWERLPGHPRCRDIVRQAKKGHWELARRASIVARENLRHVVGAEYEGTIYKVDGHTRAFLWSSGQLPPPPSVFATVYRCDSIEQLNELYTCFDTQSAAESMYDRVSGAYREHGLQLTSRRLKDGTIVDALAIALFGVARSNAKKLNHEASDFNVYEAVGTFKGELVALDSADPQKELFTTGVVAAALIELAINPSSVGFFQTLSRRESVKRGDVIDPVEAVLQHIARMNGTSGGGRRLSWVKSQHEDLAARVIYAARAWSEGAESKRYWIKGVLPAENLDLAILEMKRKKALTE